MRRASTIVPLDTVTFADVVAGAIARGASAIGYRLAASGQVVMNPPKTQLIDFGPHDEILVVGLRET